MSDITLYSQIIERNEAIRTKIAQQKAKIASELGVPSGVTWDPITWQNLPMLDQTSVGNKQLVIQNTANAGCGQCCQWTVPAGATKVQFQLWGAGANGSGERTGNSLNHTCFGRYGVVGLQHGIMAYSGIIWKVYP